ncbi:MAG: hypothetical protein WCK37_01355 [Candidatus Falkowbacteria bacterium]
MGHYVVIIILCALGVLFFLSGLINFNLKQEPILDIDLEINYGKSVRDYVDIGNFAKINEHLHRYALGDIWIPFWQPENSTSQAIRLKAALFPLDSEIAVINNHCLELGYRLATNSETLVFVVTHNNLCSDKQIFCPTIFESFGTNYLMVFDFNVFGEREASLYLAERHPRAKNNFVLMVKNP